MKTYKTFMSEAAGVHTYVAAVENATEFFSADLQIEPIEMDHYNEIKGTNLKDFMGQMSDLLDFEVEFDKRGDDKKFMKAVLGKKTFAAYDNSGDGGAIATGRSKKDIENAFGDLSMGY